MTRLQALLVGHSLATGAVVVTAAAFAAMSWAALFAWAALTGGGLGGPLALPFVVVAAMLLALLGSVIVFAPITLAVEALRRRSAWSRWSDVPVASTMTIVIVAAAAFAWTRSNGAPSSVFVTLAVGAALVGLGLYWWTLQAVDWTAAIGSRAWAALRPARRRSRW